MRKLLMLAAAGGMMFMAGWFQIHRDGEDTFLKINRDEIRTDARKAIAKGREFLDRGEQRLDEREMQDRNLANDSGAYAQDPYNANRYPAPGNGYAAPAGGQDPYQAAGYQGQRYEPQPYQGQQQYQSPQYPSPGYSQQPYQADGAQYDNYPRR